MTPVSDERLAALIRSADWWRDDIAPYRDQSPAEHRDIAECLRELQAFREERTRQMQEG